ncbi:MAG: LLM class flavin-dependent oxidoreductase [Candidatus Bathyarchaeia archaeon]|jgi:5,10-methylenetetrahydromethanopterin reductase
MSSDDKRVGLCFLDRPGTDEQLELAKLADQKGFHSIWACETRLVRDAISVLGAFAPITKRVKLAPGVINIWTRVPSLTAMTFATLDELSHGRAILGVGAYWDPLAWKQGIERKMPLTAMREFVGIMRRLFNLERFTYEGKVMKVRDIALDLGYGRPKNPVNVPIYIGATGLKMMELTGEIADGVFLNAFTSVPYLKLSLDALGKGAKKAGKKVSEIDRPQLIGVAMDEDAEKAKEAARYLVTLYLGQQPHIGLASGVKEQLIKDVGKALGGWPPTKDGPKAAMKLVDDKVVDMLTVSGTPEDCKTGVQAYVKAGASYPVILPITPNMSQMINTFGT